MLSKLVGRKTIPLSSKYKFTREAVVSKDPIPSPAKRPRPEHYEESRRPVPRPVHKVSESKHANPVKIVVKRPALYAKDKQQEPLPQRKTVRRNPAPTTQELAKLVGTAVKEAKASEKRQEATPVSDKGSTKAPENSTPTTKPDGQYELSAIMSSILHDEMQQIMIKKLPAHIKATFEERYGKDTEVATVPQLIKLLDEKIRTKDSKTSSGSTKKVEPPSRQIAGVKRGKPSSSQVAEVKPSSSQVKEVKKAKPSSSQVKEVKKVGPLSSQVTVDKQIVIPSSEPKSPAGGEVSGIIGCTYCKNLLHTLYHCDQFLQMTNEHRRLWAKMSGICLKCLQTHSGEECTYTNCCAQCNSSMHNSLVCDAEAIVATVKQSTELAVFNLSTGVATTLTQQITTTQLHPTPTQPPTETSMCCIFCLNPTHLLYQCAQFLQMTIIHRRNWAKACGLCFKCFQVHHARVCTRTDCCSHCNSPMHNWLLCFAENKVATMQQVTENWSSGISCLFCKNPTHLLYQCEQFLQMTIFDRMQWAKTSGFCFKCFEEHLARDCSRTDCCSHCNSPAHNWLLCNAESQVATVQQQLGNWSSGVSCLFCGNPTHLLYQCPQFLQMPVVERINWAKESRLCFKCFQEHFARDCSRTDCCSHCNSPMHNWLLCDTESVSCLFCSNPTHLLYQCGQFLQMTVVDRRQWAKNSGYCFKCFEEHFARDCSRTDCCSHCDSPVHNWLLCDAEHKVETVCCLFCMNPTHLLYQCAQFLQMTVADRRQWAKESKLCFKCFEEHFAWDCTCTDYCTKCKSPMHSWLMCDREAVSCLFCMNPTHLLYQCAQFLQKTVVDRRQWAKDSGYCFKCFEEHFARDCSRTDCCSHCDSPMHNWLLCFAETKVANVQQEGWPNGANCLYCMDPTHLLYQCPQFLQMTPIDRRYWARECGLCFKCFQDHFARDCSRTDCCSHCNSPTHNWLLCDDEYEVISETTSSAGVGINSCWYCNEPAHKISNCPQFIKMTGKKRSLWVKTSHRCYKCLGEHFARECDLEVWCTHCNATHNPLLCEIATKKAALQQDTESVPKKPTLQKNTGSETKKAILQQNTESQPKKATLQQNTESELNKSTVQQDTESEPKKAILQQNTESELNKSTVQQDTESESKKAILQQNTESQPKKATLQQSTESELNKSTVQQDTDSVPEKSTLQQDTKTVPNAYQSSEPGSSTYAGTGCLYCSEPSHTIYKCAQFLENTVTERSQWVKKSRRCYKCFKEHMARECDQKYIMCTQCTTKHNPLLCEKETKGATLQDTKAVHNMVQSSKQGSSTAVEIGCFYCSEPNHKLANCTQFIQLTAKRRRIWARKSYRCLKCLQEHSMDDCSNNDKCALCRTGKHNSIFCFVRTKSEVKSENNIIAGKGMTSCAYCSEPTHMVYECVQFLEMSVNDRVFWAMTLHRCYKCFEEHIALKCTLKTLCAKCNSPRHNLLLCEGNIGSQYSSHSCSFCNKSNHTILKCAQFRQLTIKDRRLRVKILELCRKCLQKHHVHQCPRKETCCTGCNSRKHNTLLCHENAEIGPSTSQDTTNVEPTECLYCRNPTHTILSCPRFIEMTSKARMRWIRKADFCPKCLEEHNVRSCTLTKLCAQCNSPKHHALLCFVKCIFCTETTHLFYKCAEFLRMTVKDRRFWAKKSKLCLKCFKEHLVRECARNDVCDLCNSPMHHTILCYEQTEDEDGLESTEVLGEKSNHKTAEATKNQITDSKKMPVSSLESNPSTGKQLDKKNLVVKTSVVESSSSQIAATDLSSEPGLSSAEVTTLEHKIPDESIQFMNTSTVDPLSSEITEAEPIAVLRKETEMSTVEQMELDEKNQVVNTSAVDSLSSQITETTPIADLSTEPGLSSAELATLEHKTPDESIQFMDTSTADPLESEITEGEPVATQIKEIEMSTIEQKPLDETNQVMDTSAREPPSSQPEASSLADMSPQPTLPEDNATGQPETIQVMDASKVEPPSNQVTQAKSIADLSPQLTLSEDNVTGQPETIQVMDPSVVEPPSNQVADTTTGLSETEMAELLEVIDEAFQNLIDTSEPPAN